MTDALGNPINPARKPWSVIADFLFQFGDGGLIFSMMDGLSAVTQAAISLGDYDVVAFEKDRICWNHAQSVISQFILHQEKQEKQMKIQLQASYDVRFSHNLIVVNCRSKNCAKTQTRRGRTTYKGRGRT